MKSKSICTITGIRPDFIRMSEIFKKLDENFNHTLIHTGQHYDPLRSSIFFDELNIREPNLNLNIGAPGKSHYEQTADLSVNLLNVMQDYHPDLIIFLGDSNSVTAAVPLKKEGYKIAHIEAGMRSGDKRMLEEINRIICDHCSDYHFVYHEDYKNNLIAENLPEENIFVVGNTIVEVFHKHYEPNQTSTFWEPHIILDIHRPENFKDKNRLRQIIFFARQLGDTYGIPVYMLDFKRTTDALKAFNLNLHKIQLHSMMSYKFYLTFQDNAAVIISDSGTAQEEPALMGVPVIVPRDYTERPQSVSSNCSFMLDLDISKMMSESKRMFEWLEHKENMDTRWLGKGNTSELIINKLKQIL